MSGPFPITAADVAAATGGRLLRGPASVPLPVVSTDSRSLPPGALFIALRGPNFDGHAFVSAALEAGATGVVVSDASAVPGRSGDAAVIVVADTLRALQDLARAVRRRSGARVVAITGSAGKTTTKEAAAAFLETRYRTLRNRGNLNNHVGLPLSLLELQAGADVAVVELGMNHAGEIARLVSIAEPDVRVWTNVGTAHLGFFASVDALADAKAEILERADRESVLVANADDPRVMSRIGAFPGRVITFGLGETADVRAADVEDRGYDGQRARVVTPSGSFEAALKLPGRGHLQNVLAAAAIAGIFDVPVEAMAERAAGLQPGPHRGQVLDLGCGARLVDDCYNSSPDALEMALATLAATPARRKVAVLGEMLELDAHAVGLHRRAGRAVADAGVALLVTVGGEAARALGEAAREAGLPADAVLHVDDSEAAAACVERRVGDGDLVLVKGSRGIGLERVVERLAAGRS
jgi:UDP-N-acetylmuramoyl-tripeptide--D-alanyl-D-alanine ligase